MRGDGHGLGGFNEGQRRRWANRFTGLFVCLRRAQLLRQQLGHAKAAAIGELDRELFVKHLLVGVLGVRLQ